MADVKPDQLSRGGIDGEPVAPRGPRGTSLLGELGPLLAVLKMYGVLPISRDKETGAAVWRWRSTAMTVSFALWLCLLVITAASARRQMQMLSSAAHQRQPLYHSTFLATPLLTLLYLPLLPATAWREAGTLCRILQRWSLIQEGVERVTGRPLAVRLRSASWFFVTVIVLVTQPATWLTAWFKPSYPLWRQLPYMQYFAFMIGAVGLWWGVCSALAQASAALAASVPPRGHPGARRYDRDTVRAHRLLWLHIHEVLVLTGNGCSRTQRTFLLLCFSEWVSTAFATMSIVLGGERPEVAVLPITLATLSAGGLFASCDAAQRAVDAVRSMSRDRLLRLPISEMEDEAVSEVVLFLHTIYTTAKNGISIEGYININRGTLMTYLKTTGTYLSVLSQFALSQAEGDS